MANPNAPFGAVPVGTLDGGYITATRYTLDSGQVAYRGDFLTLAASGNVQVATAGAEIIGVAAEYVDASSSAKPILVYDNPDIVFAVRANGSVASTDVGLNANISADAGNSSTKISGHSLNAASMATTNTLNLRILDKHPAPDNDWGSYVVLKVLINTHRLRNRTGV